MATPPVPPQAPLPVSPPPPRSPRHAILIALLILGLIVVVGILAIFIGLRALSHSFSVHERNVAGNKEVTIQTPAGNIEVHKNAHVDSTSLGLPVYPGARQVEDDHSARVSVNLPGQQTFGVVAAKFETADPIEKVRDFYHNQLGSRVTKFTVKNSTGEMVFEMKSDDQEKIVALKNTGSGTRISMVRILHSAHEAN